MLLSLIALMIADLVYLANARPQDLRLLACMVVFGLGVFGCVGFFSLQPNEARVLTLFGAYKGTVRTSGFWWGNPLYGGGRQGFAGSGPMASRQLRTQPALLSPAGQAMGRMKVSLRARTLNASG